MLPPPPIPSLRELDYASNTPHLLTSLSHSFIPADKSVATFAFSCFSVVHGMQYSPVQAYFVTLRFCHTFVLYHLAIFVIINHCFVITIDGYPKL